MVFLSFAETLWTMVMMFVEFRDNNHRIFDILIPSVVVIQCVTKR